MVKGACVLPGKGPRCVDEAGLRGRGGVVENCTRGPEGSALSRRKSEGRADIMKMDWKALTLAVWYSRN